jgi:hypothetical protein
MPVATETICPGCRLQMPARDGLVARSYYNVAPECWSVYTEVLAEEYSNAVLFAQVHQLTVDAYAVQHAGGPHPDKSVAVHLAGLYLCIQRGTPPTGVPRILQQLAESVSRWPHFEPPECEWPLTVFDVALSETAEKHAETVRLWSASVWRAWSREHAAIADFVESR